MGKVSLYEAIASLDEDTIEEICWDECNSVQVSSDAISEDVCLKIFGEKQKKRASHKLVIAVCCFMILAIPCYAAVNAILDKAAIVNDENKHLVGTEVTDDYYIVLNEDGTCVDAKGNIGTFEEILSSNSKDAEQSRLVNRIEDDTLVPASYLEVPSKKQRGVKFIYPEIIMVNNSACILTQDNSNGWNLKKGDSITYMYEKARTTTSDNQTLLVGYIHDGVMSNGEITTENKGKYEFTADEAGIYYIWILSASSDYQTIIKHSIKVN